MARKSPEMQPALRPTASENSKKPAYHSQRFTGSMTIALDRHSRCPHHNPLHHDTGRIAPEILGDTATATFAPAWKTPEWIPATAGAIPRLRGNPSDFPPGQRCPTTSMFFHPPKENFPATLPPGYAPLPPALPSLLFSLSYTQTFRGVSHVRLGRHEETSEGKRRDKRLERLVVCDPRHVAGH
jgi:hypothetical protein